jgi:hypothetical protein
MSNAIQLSDLPFQKGFNVTNPTMLCPKNSRSVIIAYEDTYKDKKYFKIHEIYEAAGEWCPGKVILIPFEHKKAFLDALKLLNV